MMTKNTRGHAILPGCATLVLAAVVFFANAANGFEIDFSKDSVEEVFDGATGTLPEVSEGMVVLPPKIVTREVPVKPGKKYKLQIMAQVDGDFVVEKNDRAHIQALQSHQNRLSSTYGITFQNGNGEEVPALGAGAMGGPWMGGFFLTNTLHPYVFVFYAPEDATSLRVTFQSNGRTTSLSSLQLVEETEEGTVNANPDFRYGELNYSGWKPSRDGRLYKRPDGKVVLNTGYGNSSSFFPLNPESRYRVSAIGEGTYLNIEYLDKNRKSIANRFLIRPTPEGAETEFVPPEGTVMGRMINVRPQLVQDIQIVEAK